MFVLGKGSCPKRKIIWINLYLPNSLKNQTSKTRKPFHLMDMRHIKINSLRNIIDQSNSTIGKTCKHVTSKPLFLYSFPIHALLVPEPCFSPPSTHAFSISHPPTRQNFLNRRLRSWRREIAACLFGKCLPLIHQFRLVSRRPRHRLTAENKSSRSNQPSRLTPNEVSKCPF